MIDERIVVDVRVEVVQLDRSLSTVDHQLRSIREKLGARSTARLVRLLAEHAQGLRDA